MGGFQYFFSLRWGSSGKGFRLFFFGCFFWNVVEAFVVLPSSWEMRELYEREHRRQRYIYTKDLKLDNILKKKYYESANTNSGKQCSSYDIKFSKLRNSASAESYTPRLRKGVEDEF